MNTTVHFKSLSAELRALQNRVRNFIHRAHWQTDGEWKESVLRSVLRRLLPRNVEVGRGFVVGPRDTSRQIDVLIYSAESPVLFRDGDLVFVTHDALRGMIEVKSGVNNRLLAQAAMKLADNAERIGRSRHRYVVGLFAYEGRGVTPQGSLKGLRHAAKGSRKRVVDLVSVGDDRFMQWWDCTNGATGKPINLWRSYHVADMAPAYFIHNIVAFICPDSIGNNTDMWFPQKGKETRMEFELPLKNEATSIGTEPIR